ncbi:MAG: HAMP domain-containing sensor histidine kinase [Cyanobacteria bacterium J06623_4]
MAAVVVSPEFVSLCQTQLRLLVQPIPDSSAAIYIAEVAEQLTEVAWRRHRSEPNFVPVVSYPESVDSWVENFERRSNWADSAEPLALPSGGTAVTSVDEVAASVDEVAAVDEASASERPVSTSAQASWSQMSLHPDRQLVIPLVYADVVVGLLVAVRRDRAWQNEEKLRVEGVAQALAAGCVLERRNQWLQGQLSDKRDLQSRQSEIFHNLLHQFRNPLTAVTTFGQLLVRRLESEDPNQKIASGIVRESKRLREMVTHFDETVAIGDADLEVVKTGPPLLPPAPRRLPMAAVPEDLPSVAETADAVEIVRSHPNNSNNHHDATPPAKVRDDYAAGLGHPLVLSAQYLPDIVEPILAVASIVANEKGVGLQSQVATDVPSVWGEEEALCEVVSNLVDNAVKYSPPGAQVWVQTGVSRISGSAQYQGIVVGDTGPGIPQADMSRLFERNFRGVQAEGDLPGTGLGLAIAQSLMLEMQGFIEVTSPAIHTPWMPTRSEFPSAAVFGPGTVFIVWLLEVERGSAFRTISGGSD